MARPVGDLIGELKNFDAESGKNSTAALAKMISADLQVGDLLKIDYSECEVLVHDHLRQKVGGLPMGCFLLSTRMNGKTTVDPTAEDSNLILLRVVGQSRLPNASETDLSRFLAGQRVAADEEVWDAEGKTDQFTLHQLRYAGIRCRVLGTFRMRQNGNGVWALTFGADISNFYSGRGMKVYKPVGPALENIVNFARSKMDDAHPLAGQRVLVGRVRYSSSERIVDQTGEGVPVQLDPTDILARRTALFGMSRTGKSNTTKVIASSVYKLRENGARVGQLIFDVNGEYANENTQDGSTENAACLKNVAIRTNHSRTDDVSTYGLWPHPNDPRRKIVKINFHGENPTNWTNFDEVSSKIESLLVGKTLIDNQLSSEESKYIKNFRNTSLEIPQVLDPSASTRYRRAIAVYRAALFAAGFAASGPTSRVNIRRLFNQALITSMGQATGPDAVIYSRASTLMQKDTVAGDELVEICVALRKYIDDGANSGYQQFNSAYARSKDGRSWHDDRLLGLLSIFEYPNGVRALRPLLGEHDPTSSGDYAQAVVDDLLAGRLVIFDQSLGDPDMNKAAAERIMWALFNRQKQSFVSPVKQPDGTLVPPSDVLVYAEEAHNLLPSGSGTNVANIWSRVAKEGSKYRIGLVYATQEPSSIQPNIMKNTDNWFVAHLNNSDETKELKKYYDFDDFVQSILQVPDPGFLRMRTLSNPYIVPIQVARFRV